MKYGYRLFNFVCFGIISICVLGNFLVWRRVWPMLSPANTKVVRENFGENPKNTDIVQSPSLENTTSASDTPTVITTSTQEVLSIAELPREFRLTVPFTSQAPEKNWEQPWQDACEEAALLMLDAYYKKYSVSPLFARDEILKMVAWEEGQGWERSIPIEQIQQLAEEFILKNSDARLSVSRAKILENPSIEDLKKNLVAGHPIYVVANGKTLANPRFRNGGPEYHALIIRGYTETHFITNDPGTQFGENFEYTYENLMDSIRDWNEGKVEEGRRVVLVLE